jgi:ferredoxin
MAGQRRVWPHRVRRIVQALAFLAFLAFIVVLSRMARLDGRADWPMRFSPLGGLGASIASWKLAVAFWPALILLLAALLLGRFFCGWLCPLGATLDAGDRAIRFLRPTGRAAAPGGQAQADKADFEHVPARRLKHYLLAACMVGAFLGLATFGLFDPLSIAVRSYVLVVHPYASKALADAAMALAGRPALGPLRAVLAAEPEPVFQLQGITLLALAALLALGLVRRRFWCRYACPLGALYALAGKLAPAKRSVTDACVECGRCAAACPMSCISPDGRRTLNDECILCLNCQPACAEGAVRFLAAAPAEQKQEVDLTRRGALAAILGGAAAYPLLRLNPARKLAKADPLIRPPLAGRDPEGFLSRCVRCGQCMRACPTHAIQPAGLEAGIESLWTPKLVPRLGYCTYDCSACGRACPSGAIPRFNLAEKHATAIGLAYVDRSRCIPWRGYERRDEEGFVADAYNCGVCEEVCPVPGKAVHFRPVLGSAEAPAQAGAPGKGGPAQQGELRLPYVRPEACVGCGFCEAVCPVEGRAAIRVTGGFRELPVSAARPAGPALTEKALPERAGSLRLAGPKTTYTGAKALYDYIDGAADPYLTFGFIRVTAAAYTDGKAKVKADLWEFKTADDAFGAFAKDREGEPAEVGDQGSMHRGSLWARRGRYMIAILNAEGASEQDVRALAVAALDALGEKPAPEPDICRRLPREKLDPSSILFLRDEAPLFNLKLADQWIPDGTFGIAGGGVAAYGAYALRSDGKQTGLLLVQHGSASAAREAVDRLTKLLASWGEKQTAQEPCAVFEAGAGDYCAIGSLEGRFATAFHAPSPEAGRDLVQAALR